MTENDRMERARRIRRMREGKRTDEDEEPGASEAAGEDPGAEAAGEDPGAEADGDDTSRRSAAPVDDPAQDPAESADGDTGSAEAAGSDVSEAMASVEDAGAAVPSAEEMAASVEDDPVPAEPDDSEAAREVAAARAARAAEVTEGLTGDETGAGTGAATEGEGPEAADAATAGEDVDDDGEPVDAGSATETGGARSTADHGASDGAEERTRVLEFTLEDEQYCLDISYIEEIVKGEYITRVPNTPEFVEGVVDLRGQITTILNPKVTIGKEDTEPGDLIVVFDGEAFEEQGYVGWIVDDVRQVSPVTDEEVNDPPMAEDYINGVIDRDEDEEFVVWTSPDLAFEEA